MLNKWQNFKNLPNFKKFINLKKKKVKNSYNYKNGKFDRIAQT